MRVEITEEVVVATEVDVDLNTVIDEWFRRLDEVDQGGVRRTVGSMLSTITNLMARVTDESIELLTADGRAEMRKRLEAQLNRY